MLSRFPREQLLEERSILLSRIHQHIQALTIYAHKLNDYKMAELYCQEHYNKDHEEDQYMFLYLLKVYLSSATKASEGNNQQQQKANNQQHHLELALQLLANYYHSIDAIESIQLIPDNTSIAKMMPYFRNLFTSIKHNRRTKQIEKIY